MHASALALMDALLNRYAGAAADVLDVGSRDENGTHRPQVEARGWRYTGLDIVAGVNVDVVSAQPYSYLFPDGAFDVVLSGQTMEHVAALWLWVPELVRVLRPGGLLAITTVWQCPEHRYPVDCWRVLPDGMRYLFDLTGQLERYEIAKYDTGDMAASAFKRMA